MKLTLIGTGNGAEDLSLGAFFAIRKAETVLLEAGDPVAALLEREGISFKETEKNTDVHKKAEAVLSLSKGGAVCYLVRGAVYEDPTCKHILTLFPEAEVLPGVSRAAKVLCGGAESMYTAVFAGEIGKESRFTLPLAVYGIADAETAAKVKERLVTLFGEKTEVLFFGKEVKKIPLSALSDAFSGEECALYLSSQAYLTKERYDFYDVVHLVRLLRAENGCPWDRVQTHESLRQNLIEEAYELVNAIDKKDVDNMEEETGDVLLQTAFHGVLAEEAGSFDIDDVTTRLCKKLIFRHSHVFGEDKTASAEEALAVWNRNKLVEKKQKTAAETLFDLPAGLPQLVRAEKTKHRSAKVNFDWKTEEGAIAKLKEEILEVEEAVKEGNAAHTEEECGDLLLAAACVVAHLGLHPELCLKAGVDKFQNRFAVMESLILADGKKMTDLSDEEYDGYWKLAKKR